ncbi:YomR [Salmonella phage SPAsTU]|nr:YomR [Salmonella phage SPAsTU]
MPREDAAQFNGTLSTLTYPNKYSAVIPVEAPFYRIGLTLTVTDPATNTKRKLIEGLDYYLGHYFKDQAEAEQDAIYGSIMLLNATNIEYELLAVGRQYRIPASEIGKALVKTDLKDPRNSDWADLMKYPPIIAPIDPPKDLDEAILRDEVVKALNDIRLGIIARASELDEAFTDVTNLIFENGKKVFDDEMYQHHLNMNAHHYTCADIRALPVLGKAVDATKAFGRTLAELVDLMSTSGIQQKHVDMLLDNTLGDLLGRMRVLNNDAITFQTTTGHVISVKGEKFIITSPQPMFLKADQDNNDPGIATEFSAGLNTLYVHSGTAANVKAPVYNGVYLVTPDMVGLYLTSVKILPANAYFKSSDTLKIYGSGKQTNRVYMNAELPGATTTVEGLFAITNLSTSVAASTAISQKAVTDLKELLDNYVDDTYTINGKAFIKDSNGEMHLTLTAADFGVDKMNNTTPLAKPVTNALKTVLAGKVASDHTHTIADLDNVPYASTSTTGLAKLWDAIDTTADKMVTSRQGFLLDERINEMNEKISTLLPAWTVGGAQYGNQSFLPIPTVSNFAGFGFNRANPWGAARYEAGNVYMLRNGSDGPEDTRRVYYWYGNVDANNKFTNTYPTAFPYHPAGMSKFPGVTLLRVLTASEDVGLFEGSDGAKYLVLFNGTMNYAKHSEVYKVTFPDLTRTTGGALTYDSVMSFITVALAKTHVVFMMTHVTSDSFKVGGWSVALNALKGTDPIAFSVIPLSYAKMNGDVAQIVDDGAPENDNTATTRLAYVTQGARDKWTRTRTPVNYRPSFFSAAKLNNVRVRSEMHSYFADDKSASWSDAWSVVYNVDIDTGVLTVENPLFPVAITENKIEFPNGTRYKSVTNRNIGVAIYANLFANADFMIDSWSDVYSNNPTNISITPLAGTEFYDLLGSDTTLNESSNVQVIGAVGSVYKQYMRGIIHLGGAERTMLLRYLATSTCISMRYDLTNKYFPDAVGYGPDNLRVAQDISTYNEFALTPNVWKGNKLYLNGRVINAAGSYPYKNVDGTTTFTADRITVSDALWASLETAIGAALPLWNDAETIDKQFNVHTFDIGGLNAAFLVATCRTWENADHIRAYCRTTVWKIPMTVNSGNVSFGTTGWVVAVPEWRDGEAAISLMRDQVVNSKLVARDDGYVIQLGAIYRSGVVGDSRWRTYVMTCDQSFDNWTNTMRAFNPGIAEADLYIQPETGYIGYTKWLYLGLYVAADIYQNTSRTFATGTPVETYLAGVKTAEGWNLYITEEELLSFGSSRYTIPTYGVDIRDLYPTNYKNRTLYMHAVLNNGNPEYQLLEQQMPDTSTRLYIGYMTSDSERITFSNFDRVKRLGAVKQLLEHESVAYRHDMDVGRDQKLGRLGPLYKEPIGAIATDSSHGYLDSQQLSSVVAGQKRTRKGVSQVFSGLSQALITTQSNTAYKYWKKPTNIVSVTADESAEGAAYGMQWIGVPQPAVVPATTDMGILVRGKYIIPGTVGDSTAFDVRVLLPFGSSGTIINTEEPGVDVDMDNDPNALETPADGSVVTLRRYSPAGIACTITILVAIPKDPLTDFGLRDVAWQIVDLGGNVVAQGDESSYIGIVPLGTATLGTPVVFNARTYTFTDVDGAIPFVTTGAEGIAPALVSTPLGNGDTEITVAHHFMNERGEQKLDEVQVNLMFRT